MSKKHEPPRIGQDATAATVAEADNRCAVQRDQGHSTTYTPEQIARAERTLRAVAKWRDEYHGVYIVEVVGWALRESRAGHTIHTQLVVERLRARDYAGSDGTPLHLGNDAATVFARWLWRDYPSVRPFIRLRPSVFDALILGGLYGRA